MKKVSILFLIILFLRIDLYSQQNTNLLFHWEDTTLVGSSAYNNTYNEIWGLNINGSEIAIIGSTAGTHFFDVTNPQNSIEIAFVQERYRW